VTVAGRRRRLGFGLVAFGAVGLALSVIGALLVLATLGAVGDAASGFERQRTELLSMVEPAASALTDAADSASHAGASLTEASDASRRAADLTTRLAGSFEALAGLGSVDILGSRPFAGFSSQFADAASQSRTLSTDLTTTADALATNVADSEAVALDLRALAERLRQLETSVGGGTGPGSATAVGIAVAQIVVLGLLVWLSVLAVASLWLGLRLVRNRPIGSLLEG
jgi:hypothetical protein